MSHDLGWLLDRVAEPEWWALAAAVGCHALAILLHTRAWTAILSHEYGRSRVRWRRVLGGYAAGSALNAVVPARAGIVLKLFVIKSGIPGATYPVVLATLGALGIFDLLVTAGIVAFGIQTTLLPNLGRLVHYRAFIGRVAVEHPGVTIVASAALVALLVLIGLVLCRPLRRLARELLQGLRVLADPRFYLTRVLPLQVLNWVAQLAALGFFLAAFGLPATPRTVLVAQAAKSLAILIPFTPNGAGAQFALLMLAFGRRFEPLAVSAFAVGMRASTTLFNVAVGGAAILLMLGMARRRRASYATNTRPAIHPRRRSQYSQPTSPTSDARMGPARSRRS